MTIWSCRIPNQTNFSIKVCSDWNFWIQILQAKQILPISPWYQSLFSHWSTSKLQSFCLAYLAEFFWGLKRRQDSPECLGQRLSFKHHILSGSAVTFMVCQCFLAANQITFYVGLTPIWVPGIPFSTCILREHRCLSVITLGKGDTVANGLCWIQMKQQDKCVERGSYSPWSW